MRNPIFKKIINIGFKYHKSSCSDFGRWLEYKYYPSRLNTTHFTLFIFVYKNYSKQYRLYIHNNSDGSFVDTPFQIYDSFQHLINAHLNEIFKLELRLLKLNKLE